MGKEDLGASPGAEGWKDVLQLLREQSEKMEVLARALSVIQQAMLKNNPGHVKDSANKATKGEKRIGSPRKGRAAHRHPTLWSPEARLHKRMGNGSWCKRIKRKKKIEKEERGSCAFCAGT